MKNAIYGMVLALTLVATPAFAGWETPCYWIYTFPYVEKPDDPGGRELSIDKISEDLKLLGIVKWFAFEVGGNRAVTCLIGARLTPVADQLRDLLHGIGAGTKIHVEGYAREIFDAPWYQPYWDEGSQDILLSDGLDGRPLATFPTSPARLDELKVAATRWIARCGTLNPLPAGCN